MLVVGEQAHKHIDTFSQTFKDEFLTHLSRRHGTQRVRANAVYNEYIQDKHHIHMNSTQWVTLTEFIKYLGREGLVRVDENEKGFWVTWVDNSPKALARQAEVRKRERADVDDEQRQRRQLKEQMERAKAQAELAREREGVASMEEGLKSGGDKISLSLTPAPTAAVSTTSISTATSNPANPLKRPATTNVFKSKKPKTSSTEEASSAPLDHLAGKKFLTAAERVMLEDQQRNSPSHKTSGYQGMGPSRGAVRR